MKLALRWPLRKTSDPLRKKSDDRTKTKTLGKKGKDSEVFLKLVFSFPLTATTYLVQASVSK